MTSGERFALILAVAALTYAARVAGFALVDRTLPPIVTRFLAYVPIAAFAALAVPGVVGVSSDGLAPRLLAAAVASLVTLRFGQLWACLVAGMATFWLATWLLG